MNGAMVLIRGTPGGMHKDSGSSWCSLPSRSACAAFAAPIASSKAATDATSLAAALAANLGDPDFALRAWERQQLNHGRGLAEHAIALGRRSVRQRDGSQPPTPSVRDVAERFAGIAQPLPRE